MESARLEFESCICHLSHGLGARLPEPWSHIYRVERTEGPADPLGGGMASRRPTLRGGGSVSPPSLLNFREGVRLPLGTDLAWWALVHPGDCRGGRGAKSKLGAPGAGDGARGHLTTAAPSFFPLRGWSWAETQGAFPFLKEPELVLLLPLRLR